MTQFIDCHDPCQDTADIYNPYVHKDVHVKIMIMIDTFRHELLLDHMGNSDGEHDTHDLQNLPLFPFMSRQICPHLVATTVVKTTLKPFLFYSCKGVPLHFKHK